MRHKLSLGRWGPRRTWHRSRGQSMVEFALILPVIFLLLMITVDFGRAYLGWVNVNVAAREAANFAALSPRGWEGAGDATIKSHYASLVTNETSGINCAVASPVPAPTFSAGATLGGDAVVSISCAFQPITPFITAIIGNTVPITARAVFPVRTGSIASLPTSGDGGGSDPIPVANFSGDQLNGVAPLTVSFSDLSSNAPAAWVWTFGDGGSSTSQNPTHTYTTSGIYTVSLTASNVNGNDAEIKVGYITVTATPPGPNADFNLTPDGGRAPLSVSFTDASTGPPTTWAWDFGNDASVDATTQNASHTYTTDGTFPIRLTVSNALGSSSIVKTITIDPKICTVPNFAGVKVSDAPALWTSYDFTVPVTFMPPSNKGNADYKISYQSKPGGVVDPQPGGCAFSITVGP